MPRDLSEAFVGAGCTARPAGFVTCVALGNCGGFKRCGHILRLALIFAGEHEREDANATRFVPRMLAKLSLVVIKASDAPEYGFDGVAATRHFLRPIPVTLFEDHPEIAGFVMALADCPKIIARDRSLDVRLVFIAQASEPGGGFDDTVDTHRHARLIIEFGYTRALLIGVALRHDALQNLLNISGQWSCGRARRHDVSAPRAVGADARCNGIAAACKARTKADRSHDLINRR